MANEFLPLDSERFADAFTASPIPSELSQEQKNFFCQMIKDNPDGFSEEISL